MKVSDKEYALLRAFESVRSDISFIRDHIDSSLPDVDLNRENEIRIETASCIVKKLYTSSWYLLATKYPVVFREFDKALRDIAKQYNLYSIF